MSKKMSNQEIADLLKGIAAVYQIKGDRQFRVKAYEEAAASIEHATSSIKDLWDDKKLETLPGVGEAIASYLDELFRTGKVKHFQKLMKDFPPAMFEFLQISGVGAKTAYKLAKELKISASKEALKRLKKAAKSGKIHQLEGFAEESEKAISEGVKEISKRGKPGKRMGLAFARELAEEIIDYLKKDPRAQRVDPLGSLRRMTATVGDIDISVATPKPKEIIERFVKMPGVEKVVAAGSRLATIIHRSGKDIDLMAMEPDSYGALLQHFTGSKQHNIHLRRIAQKKGWSLSQYGIQKGKKSVKKFRTEKDFYQELGMDWIPPELREDVGEIETAQKHQLPKLVELKEIKGDLHIHSNYPIEPSHDLGTTSIKEIVVKGRKKGYEYVGLSEHNPSLSRHSEKQIIDILKRKKETIEQFKSSNKKLVRSTRLLNGLEISIRPDGDLAIPEKGFEYLDYAIVSVHSSFRQPRDKATKRVLKALSHPKAIILGHPTGRMLGRREGMEFDWNQIFNFCRKNKKYLEINALTARLDLPDRLVQEAVKNGVKMVIDTDAHRLEEMDLMEYGLSVARRGWAQKKDIINTLSYDKIAKVLERR